MLIDFSLHAPFLRRSNGGYRRFLGPADLPQSAVHAKGECLSQRRRKRPENCRRMLVDCSEAAVFAFVSGDL
jgi:hypothetical protein